MQKKSVSQKKDEKITNYQRFFKSQKKKIDNQQEKIVFTIIDDNQMGVYLPFKLLNQQYKQIVKSASGKWDPTFKIWRVPKSNYTKVRTQIPQVNPTALIEDPSQLSTRALLEPTQNLKLIKLNKIISYPSDDKQRDLTKNELYQKLYPFQRQTLQLAVKKHGRLLIADQMGVGKTLQSLACALEYFTQWPLLIICPSALKFIWMDQIGKWMNKIINKQQVQILIKNNIPIRQQQIKILIVSYQMASKSVDQLNNFKVSIVDQAHYLKSSTAQRSQNLVPFLASRKRIFLLTGTPALAKPRQLYNLASIIRPDIFTNLKQFGDRYCKLQRNPWSGYLEYEGSRNTAELYYILKNKIMIRRLKSQVLHDLPQKQRQTVVIQTQKSIVKEIKQLLSGGSISVETLRNSQKILQACFEDQKKSDMSCMPRCYQLTGLAKINGVKAYIQSVLENDVKILVFAHHKVVLDQLETFIKSLKCELVRIDGQISHQLRQKKVKAFQEQRDIRVALLSITCAGVGYTLVSASTVIFAEMHWTPAMLLQAEDRAHRIGQKNSVNAHYLIGQNTLDPILYRALQRKVATVGKVLNGTNQTMGAQQLEKGSIGKISKTIKIQENMRQQRITSYLNKYKPIGSDIESDSKQQLEQQEKLAKLIKKKRQQYQKSRSNQ